MKSEFLQIFPHLIYANWLFRYTGNPNVPYGHPNIIFQFMNFSVYQSCFQDTKWKIHEIITLNDDRLTLKNEF